MSISFSVSVLFFIVLLTHVVAVDHVVAVEEKSVPGIMERTYASVTTDLSYDVCTKLHHHLSWYNLWRLSTYKDVYQAFILFAEEIILYWFLFYVAFCGISCYRGKFGWPSSDWNWVFTIMSVLGHVYFVFVVTFLVFCYKKDVFESYNAIKRHARSPTGMWEYMVFVGSQKEEVGCFEAVFGKQSYTTIVFTGVWFLFCKACVAVAVIF
jgi:hypothetical protein